MPITRTFEEEQAKKREWLKQADVACLLARMHPDRCIEYFLDSNNKQVELKEGRWHIVYCLENGKYKVKDQLKYDWKIEEKSAPSIRIAKIDNEGRFSMYDSRNPFGVDKILCYLRENPKLENIPGVLMLAQAVKKNL